MLAMFEDLHEFSNNAKKDFSLYKSLRTYFNQSRAKLKNQQKMLKEIDKSNADLPTYLNFDETLEKYSPKTITNLNPVYQKITDTYFKIDLKVSSQMRNSQI